MRITAALYKYTGGSHCKMFDTILMRAGLLTSERDCLIRLWDKSQNDYEKNRTLFNYRNEIYSALYGELDSYIVGEDQPSMLEQQEVLTNT